MGAIKPCEPVKDQFLSSYFLVKKSDGSYRFVINLKKLNKFVKTSHFKMEDGKTASLLLSKNDFLRKLDLQNAYYSFPIHESCRKYLRFEFNSQLYEFTCLPFGLSVAPWVFTKILKPAANYLRRMSHKSVFYLDDILCMSSSYENCTKNMNMHIQKLPSLGFLINYKKSILIPITSIKFLGIKYNLVSVFIMGFML